MGSLLLLRPGPAAAGGGGPGRGQPAPVRRSSVLSASGEFKSRLLTDSESTLENFRSSTLSEAPAF